MCIEEIEDSSPDRIYYLLNETFLTSDEEAEVKSLLKELSYLWYRQERFNSDRK